MVSTVTWPNGPPGECISTRSSNQLMRAGALLDSYVRCPLLGGLALESHHGVDMCAHHFLDFEQHVGNRSRSAVLAQHRIAQPRAVEPQELNIGAGQVLLRITTGDEKTGRRRLE